MNSFSLCPLVFCLNLKTNSLNVKIILNVKRRKIIVMKNYHNEYKGYPITRNKKIITSYRVYFGKLQTSQTKIYSMKLGEHGQFVTLIMNNEKI